MTKPKNEILDKIKPRKEKVLVHNMEKGERMVGKIVIRDDNAQSRGVRPRWAQVFAIGEGISDIEEGDWILIEHGRWSRGLDFNDEVDSNHSQENVLHLVDYPASVLLVSKEKPEAETFGAEDK